MTGGGGYVVGLHASAGGVPKLPVAEAVVRATGMVGDRQRNRRFHGGPDRALCMYSQERLDALAGEGHPAAPGMMGENVTVAGLEWDLVRPGTRWRIGGVVGEVAGFAAPCKQIADAFRDGEFSRVGQKSNPGWSRVYLRIVREGRIVVGDPVNFLDPSSESGASRAVSVY